MTETRPGIDPFDADAAGGEGYIYTTTKQLSSRLAVARQQDLVLALGHFDGKSVLDVGCGDGFYTMGYWDRGHPTKLVGIDAAANAINVANKNKGDRPIHFEVGDFHNLAFQTRPSTSRSFKACSTTTTIPCERSPSLFASPPRSSCSSPTV